MKKLIDILDREGCSLVIRHNDVEQCYRQRGVADLYDLLHTTPDVLQGAVLADKVIGKGAAALMVLGGVRQVYAHVLSQPALELLQQAGITVTYGQCVEHIINRAGTDWCPVEKLCHHVSTAEECLPLIEKFIQEIRK